MEKQHNRGQDGAGIACIKLDLEPGKRYINRSRSSANNPVNDIFLQIFTTLNQLNEKFPERLKDVQWLKNNVDYTGEIFLGHLRYGTFGKNVTENLHPVIRENNWKTKNLVLAGNFNLTNVDDLFNKLVELGQYPQRTSDTVTILEKIGHFLDEENESLYRRFKSAGYVKKDITQHIADNLNLIEVLSNAAESWDGGYALAGMLGHGDAFALRDPWGIRPLYYFHNQEVVVVTSERPAIQTAFNVPVHQINEVMPGHALVIKKNGVVGELSCLKPKEKKSCSFERIYFSRGTDADIYRERKSLGAMLVSSILESINYDLENTVFSYIPNTATVAFYGMIEELTKYCNKVKCEKLLLAKDQLDEKTVNDILRLKPRAEKVAVKDLKLRTFITQDSGRDDLVAHVYDVTYGVVRPDVDNLVVIDDSIVRGTTLRQSIIRILDRLHPKHIIIASSAPQIRYPDCYGIDMARLSDFIAFNAAIALLRETRRENIIDEVYKKCKQQENLPKEQMINYVKEIYRPFTAAQIAEKISRMVRTKEIRSEVSIVFNSIENLHQACPGNTGDWYFTGNYPTPGGIKVVNRSFINFIEGKNERAYQH